MHKLNPPAGGSRRVPSAKMTKDALTKLGIGQVAYMRKIGAADLATLFPGVPPVDKSMQLYALLNADGSPIILADSPQAVLENAWENELQMVSVH
ncbi:hypothetical protein GCM10011316_19030 [Roseibium aquae]|uniref:DUF1150 domain-containing protein n=1 Tax=Roseibium aquae TaxID=1323746 RepID=A0A916TJJ0_9HYPH|nr:DUF1150 domain-containing protein [Roseibium aquae]GGB47124.1 hypothetical protein GCM10011316_19030 [Roseibium aquae]